MDPVERVPPLRVFGELSGNDFRGLARVFGHVFLEETTTQPMTALASIIERSIAEGLKS